MWKYTCRSHIKSFTIGQILIMKQKATRKWPTTEMYKLRQGGVHSITSDGKIIVCTINSNLKIKSKLITDKSSYTLQRCHLILKLAVLSQKLFQFRVTSFFFKLRTRPNRILQCFDFPFQVNNFILLKRGQQSTNQESR